MWDCKKAEQEEGEGDVPVPVPSPRSSIRFDIMISYMLVNKDDSGWRKMCKSTVEIDKKQPNVELKNI